MALFGKKEKSATKPQAAPDASMQDLYKDTTRPAAGAKKKSVARPASESGKILLRPLITEKATNLGMADKYVFVVAGSANKISVARAIQAVYGVKPLKVNVLNMSGKRVSRGRVSGQRSDWRKAIITLPKGETIKIYEGV